MEAKAETVIPEDKPHKESKPHHMQSHPERRAERSVAAPNARTTTTTTPI